MATPTTAAPAATAPDAKAPATAATPNVETARNTGNAGGSAGRMIDSKAAIAILNKRITVTPADAGSSLQLSIQGSGQFLAKGHKYTVAGAERENGFDRTIYNVRASSSLLMTLADNKRLFTDGMKAESTGDAQAAHDLFNAYLNATQLSFSVIMPSSRVYHSGDDIKARITSVVSLAGVTSLQLDDVSYVAPKVKLATKFEVSDLIEA